MRFKVPVLSIVHHLPVVSAFRAGIELREDPVKPGQVVRKAPKAIVPARHYPTGYDARVLRLAEIERSLRSTRTPIPSDHRRELEFGMNRMTLLEVAPHKLRLWRYLRDVCGIKNPQNMFNWIGTNK